MIFSSDEIATMMAAYTFSPDVQTSQTRFRKRLVDGWKISSGMRILEIGCGQGDMTAVLADAVGSHGQVTAVDLADPAYGAPVCLGDSMRYLKQGPLGNRIEYHLGFDVLDTVNAFADDAFDVIVLAHCTWYFASLDQLRQVFLQIRPWASRLFLSEWDLQPVSINQMGHLLAVWIQGQVEAYKPNSEANVRTPYSRETLRILLSETNWNISSESLVDSSDLADARWEIAQCLGDSLREAAELKLPAKLQALLQSQRDVLQRLADQGENRPLPSYSIIAQREP